MPVAAAAPAKKKRSARSLILPIVALGLLGAAGWYGYQYWTDGRFMISTDDAYVQADMTFMSPKISGYVATVPVVENQHVKAGDPLVIMDDGDYTIAVAQTEAEIVTQGKTLERIAAQTEAAKASLLQAEAQKSSAQAAATNAVRGADRAGQLVKSKVGTSRSSTTHRRRSIRPRQRSPAPMRRSPAPRPISACSRRSMPKPRARCARLS